MAPTPPSSTDATVASGAARFAARGAESASGPAAPVIASTIAALLPVICAVASITWALVSRQSQSHGPTASTQVQARSRTRSSLVRTCRPIWPSHLASSLFESFMSELFVGGFRATVPPWESMLNVRAIPTLTLTACNSAVCESSCGCQTGLCARTTCTAHARMSLLRNLNL